jgi:hypothetical protein
MIADSSCISISVNSELLSVSFLFFRQEFHAVCIRYPLRDRGLDADDADWTDFHGSDPCRPVVSAPIRVRLFAAKLLRVFRGLFFLLADPARISLVASARFG